MLEGVILTDPPPKKKQQRNVDIEVSETQLDVHNKINESTKDREIKTKMKMAREIARREK